MVIVKRPPRALPRAVPAENVRLQPPPALPRNNDQGLMMSLLPMLGMAGSAAYFFTTSQPIMMMMGCLMLASSGAMAVAQFVRMRRGAASGLADMRREYLMYLTRLRQEVRSTAEQQRGAQLFTHPAPEQLWSLVSVTGGPNNRVWERRPTDPDFAQIRFGLGPQRLATALIPPQAAPSEALEPLTEHALGTFVRTHSLVEDLPLAVSLRAFYHLTLSGERETVYGTARAVLSQLATLHSPEDLIIGVVTDPAGAPQWEWTKWLPHNQRPGTADGAGTRRLFCGDLGELETMLAKRLEDRPRFNGDSGPLLDKAHIVVVLDGGAVPQDSVFAAPEGVQGVTVIEVVPGELGRPRGGLSVVVQPGSLVLEAADGTVYEGLPDVLSEAETDTLARQLAPLRIGSSGGDDEEPLLADLDFTDLLQLGDAGSVDTARTWRPRSPKDRLRVPIGVGENGEPVMLDIKEASLEGMGPHGLCVGATGSGKSELLRTLVLGLAVTHSSETLNFVLADFKGGATFAGMAQMPHVSAVITNLADDLTLVDRMRDSITGELQRRQELLAATGQKDITSYEKARAAGSALEPLPNLLLIIDEFSELLTEKPDFIDMFIQIGRIGRSLGVHLLLASQRLEEGRLRGLDTYLSYRIGLRTFSASESRAALGVPDAYHLPSVPGSGYLKFGTETMVRFKAAYVSGPYRSRGTSQASGPLPLQRRPVLFTAAEVKVQQAAPQPVAAPVDTEDNALADTVLDVIVRRLEGQGAPAHEVWLPPLAEPPSLDQLLPQLAVTPERGLTAPGLPGLGSLEVALGIVDKPFEQRRDVLRLDFSGAAGHLLVVGGPRSGKSTLIRTLIGSFALTHTPAEVQFYGLDFGGGGMLALDGLPHVGGVASRLDTEKVRRTVAEVAGILNRREEFFRANTVDSISTYRRRRAAGELPGEQWGDVFLVVDGWMSFRSDYELLESVVTDIASRGLGFGIHVILTATRYSEVRPALKDQVQARLELRLGDPMESEFDRKVAQNVPATAPGRGLTPQRLHYLTGLPRIDSSPRTADLSDGTAAFVATVDANWSGPRAPKVRMLPATLPAHQLPKGNDFPQQGVAIGIDEVALEPAFVNFETDPHFLVFGESESGKTALLRLLIKQITERYTPEQGRIIMVDYRRTLLGAVPESHLVEFAASAPALEQFAGSIRSALAARVPNSEVTQEQLRNRSWWTGPEMFLIVDDYELVASSSNPLSVLVDLLPLAKDIGLHVILARNTAGASRSLYEGFMNRLRELSTQGLLLSGDRDEGALLGNQKPTRLPPGRGFHVSRRRGSQLIQTGWLPER